jgi:hypothetical protein
LNDNDGMMAVDDGIDDDIDDKKDDDVQCLIER